MSGWNVRWTYDLFYLGEFLVFLGRWHVVFIFWHMTLFRIGLGFAHDALA
jgi:hypothetical protein